MAKSKGPKVYAVAKGRAPGIYGTWNECQAQTKGYSGAVFKSFKTRYEADAFMRANSSSANSSVASSSAAASSNSAQGRKRARDNDTASYQQTGHKKRAAQLTQPQQSSSGKANAKLHIIIHFDGGSRGNPGVAGAGAEVVVLDQSATKLEVVPGVITSLEPIKTTHEIREYCGERKTNNFAEYRGLLAGLRKAKEIIEQFQSISPNIPLFRLEVYGDSNLIIQQLRGAWQCKNLNILPLYQQGGNLLAELRSIDRKSEIVLEHVYREQNKAADALANEAMDQRKSWTTSTCDGSSYDGANDEKKPAAAVAASAPTAKTIRVPVVAPWNAASTSNANNVPTASRKSRRKATDVDGSDNDSHYSC